MIDEVACSGSATGLVDMVSTSVDHDRAEQWERFSRDRSLYDPPIPPSSEDLAHVWVAASEWIQERAAPRILLLGVTPELCSLPWPAGTELLAVDHSQVAIDALWPGPRDAVQCADWLAMDLPQDSQDIVLCDAGLHVLDYPHGQRRLVRLLHRVLSSEGLCIFRLFVLPTPRESPERVLQDLYDGNISNLSHLKIRLFMSMQTDPKEGVELGRVYDTLFTAVPDFERLAAKIGWPAERTAVIHNYRGLKSRFHLLTLEQTIDLFCADVGGFVVQRVMIPSYDLGQRCPTVALRRVRRTHE
jgi:SAM-dependent methyltransferase